MALRSVTNRSRFLTGLHPAVWFPGSQEGAESRGHGAGVLVTSLPTWIFPWLMVGWGPDASHPQGWQRLFCDGPRSSVPSKAALPFWNQWRQPNGFKNHWGRTRRHTAVRGVWVCEPRLLEKRAKNNKMQKPCYYHSWTVLSDIFY